MSEIAEKIAEILKDPESLGMINGIAKSLMGDGGKEETGREETEKEEHEEEIFSESLTVPENAAEEEKEERHDGNDGEKSENILPEEHKEPEEKGKTQRELRHFLSKVRVLLENGNIDNTLRLITALKPYMSRERRASAERVQGFLRAARLFERISPSDMARLLSEGPEKR